MNSSQRRLYDARKYIGYFFDGRGFEPEPCPGTASPEAIQAAGQARGADRGPAIFIHGVMPRSGTVYVAELLRRHPGLYANPHQLWEFPGLLLAADIPRLQDKFLLSYKPNVGKLQEGDFLTLFGAGMMAYLHQPAPAGTRLLVKLASVQYLNHFSVMFPHEQLLILMRDGRDLVHSTLRTWPGLNFVQVTLRWDRSARAALKVAQALDGRAGPGHWLARFEDALADPAGFVRAACHHFGLDEGCYPFEEIDNIRVIGSSKLGQKAKFAWRHLKKPEEFRPTRYWEDWSSRRKLLFKFFAGQSLIDLGYCQDLRW
ncbi:MAG: sulfotransferase [Candidatus Promineifilaceae bacterium]